MRPFRMPCIWGQNQSWVVIRLDAVILQQSGMYCRLRDTGNVWSDEDVAIFQAALRYLEYQVQVHDEQRAQNIS